MRAHFSKKYDKVNFSRQNKACFYFVLTLRYKRFVLDCGDIFYGG